MKIYFTKHMPITAPVFNFREHTPITALVFDGYYGSSKVRMEQVNAACSIATNELHELMNLHPITQKVKTYCPEDSLVVFSSVLASMLRLQKQTYEEGVHEGDQVVDIHRDFYSFYV